MSAATTVRLRSSAVDELMGKRPIESSNPYLQGIISHSSGEDLAKNQRKQIYRASKSTATAAAQTRKRHRVTSPYGDYYSVEGEERDSDDDGSRSTRIVRASGDAGMHMSQVDFARAGGGFGDRYTHPSPFGDSNGASMLQVAEALLGKPRVNVSGDPNAQYSVESKDLPAAFTGPRPEVTRIILNRVTKADMWPVVDLLPFAPLTDPRGGVIKQLIFNDHHLQRTAYEVAGRTVTNRQSAITFETGIYQIGQTLERGFYMTEMGRLHWACGIEQMARATIETLCMMSVSEVLTKVDVVTVPEEELGVAYTRQTYVNMLRKTVELWDALKRLRHGVHLVAQAAKNIFEARNQSGPMTLVLPTGAAQYVAMKPEETEWKETGRAVPQGDPWRNGNELKVKDVAKVRESRKFRASSRAGAIDPMVRDVAIGGFAFVPPEIPTADIYEDFPGAKGDAADVKWCKYKTEHGGVERYFDHSDKVERITVQQALRGWGFYHGGVLTGAGALYFSRLMGRNTRGRNSKKQEEWRRTAESLRNDPTKLTETYKAAEFEIGGIHSVGAFYEAWGAGTGKNTLDRVAKCIHSRIVHSEPARKAWEQLKLVDAALGIPDRTKVSDALHKLTLMNDQYWQFAIDHDVPLYMGWYAAFPNMTYRSACALVSLPGLGNTLAGYGDYTIGLRPLTRIYDASWRLNAACVVTEPKRGVIIENAFISDYVGGNENKCWRPEDHATQYRTEPDDRKDGSMFIFMLWPGFERGSRTFFDISGRHGINVVREEFAEPVYEKYHYCTALIYAAMWGFAPLDRELNVKYADNQHENTIVWQEFQRTCNAKGDYFDLWRGAGHWGQRADSGCRAHRFGTNPTAPMDIYHGCDKYKWCD